jgi:glycosyltransferase involved in cell wall biosynthesis
MQSRTIWILQTGEPLHIDGENIRPMRAMNLSNALVNAGHRVVLWSSAFYHQEKRHRGITQQNIRVSNNLEIRLIPSCGYRHNIGLGRLIDHVQLAINLKKMLKQSKDLPDVAFIGYPPVETAAVMVRWLSHRDIPTLLDLKDQWPAIFLEVMPSLLRPLGRMVLWPYFYLAKRAMQEASGLSAMASGFLGWGLEIAGRVRTDKDGVFPLTSYSGQVSGPQLDKARQWWDDQGVFNDTTIKVCYVGNHSPNVDLSPVKTAASLFYEQKIPIEFIIAGDGVSTLEFRTMMAGLPNVRFPGRLDRSRFIALSERAHASIIPYVNSINFQNSLPNKTFDSLALGLPILSPLKGEVASLISEYDVGICYGTDTGRTLYDCIKILTQDDTIFKKMSQNARALYTDRFSFEIVYGGLVKHIEWLASL